MIDPTPTDITPLERTVSRQAKTINQMIDTHIDEYTKLAARISELERQISALREMVVRQRRAA